MLLLLLTNNVTPPQQIKVQPDHYRFDTVLFSPPSAEERMTTRGKVGSDRTRDQPQLRSYLLLERLARAPWTRVGS